MTTTRDLARTARRLAAAGLIALALAAPGAARAFEREFAAGSLIIPTQQEYQTDCGMVSAYGLVYLLLYKNASLPAGKKPVTVYWIIEPRKQSHHRCDTATDTLPSYASYNDNDGCDFAVQNAEGRPVSLLQGNNTEQLDFTVWTTTYDSTGTSARSATQNMTINAPVNGVGGKKVMKYSGGLWVIDATDRATVFEMLAGTSFDPFRRGGSAAACANLGGTHQVNIHSARIAFTAPVAKMINAKPPLIALVGSEFVGILEDYLENAGLSTLTGAAGTPTSHGIIYDVLEPLTDFLSTPTYPRGKVNMPDPVNTNTTFYQVLWAPHWEAGLTPSTGGSDVLPADGALGDDTTGDGRWTHGGLSAVDNALQNIAAFSDTGNGIFAECASIQSFEGSYSGVTDLCSGFYRCECTDTSTNNPTCAFGTIKSLTCDAGYTAACGNCYSCPSGYTLDASVCGAVTCVPTAKCPAGTSEWVGCDRCVTCSNATYPDWVRPRTCDSTPYCWKAGTSSGSGNRQRASRVDPPTANVAPTVQASTAHGVLSCGTGYSEVCVDSPAKLDTPGFADTRFHMTNRLVKNQLGRTYQGRDCSDDAIVSPATGSKYRTASAITGDCINYHADSGGPGNTFAQKGNFNFDGTDGLVRHYEPAAAVGSFYHPQVLRFAESRNTGDADRSGWDFVTARHKDGDPSKGMVVYLAGHSYANDPGGNRWVLNTLLNLGFTDSAVELARSEPVGYVTWGKDASGNPVIAAQTIFQGTYEQHPLPGPFQDWKNYNPLSAKAWRFPFTDGHLRAYPLSALSTVAQDFSANASWDAAARLPLPANRTIFTTLGGSANLGWKRVNVHHTQTDQSTCTGTGANDGRGQPICLLSSALSQCSTAGVQATAIQAGDPTGALARKLGFFVQQVRGHCAAHSSGGAEIMVPTDDQCDDKVSRYQRNRARLGGIDHASPAIVGPSPYIGDERLADGTLVRWSQRPVIAYAGARDGMLHAIYVSGDTAWTAGGATLPAGVQGGQELWAYLPPAQLCGLSTNIAMVDANVSAIDVFGDFPKDANGDGVFDHASTDEKPDGIREWRTLVVAAAGEGGSELFVLDVTNPLKPALLWHLSGSDNHDDRFDVNADGDFADFNDHMSTGSPATYASTWFNWDDGNTTTAHIPTDYNTATPAVLNALKFGRYDYRNMHKTLGTAVGTIWSGRSFKSVAYLATSSADYSDAVTPLGYKGIEVFAVDLATGQKLWQWQNRYRRMSASGEIADNGIPGRPALVDVDFDGSVDRVYVGDLEGHLWELSALDGRNLNYLRGSDGQNWSFPLFGTPPMTGGSAPSAITDLFRPVGGTALAQQPLTSPIGVGRFTVVPTSPVDLRPYLKDRQSLAQGTMGVDWAIAPFENGHVYVVPAHPETGTRLLPPLSIDASDDRRLKGVLRDQAVWDTVLDVNERVFGMPKIVDNEMFINTSQGNFQGDLTASMYDQGMTYKVTATTKTSIDSGQKRFGGVLMMGTDVVVTSDTSIVRKVGAGRQPGVDTKVRDRYTPTTSKSWEQQPDGKLP